MNNGSIQCIFDNVDLGRSVRFGYDPLQRMTSAKTCGSSAYSQWGLAQSYDRFGNRLTQAVTAGSGPSTNMSFSNNNQPTGYTFDPSGNMTVEPLSPPNNMTYDGENRMTAFSGLGGAASYTYDGNGLRVAKSANGGATTVSIFSGSTVIAEYDNGAVPGSPSREYVAGPTGLLAMFSGGATTYYHRDHLSVRLTTDGNGNVVTQEGHFPFGEQWYTMGQASKWFFTSYDRDSESGLDYALARYYNSRTGTFLVPDPVTGKPGDPQSWNRYPYGRNDPIDVTDPTGKFIEFLPMFIAMVAEAAATSAGFATVVTTVTVAAEASAWIDTVPILVGGGGLIAGAALSQPPPPQPPTTPGSQPKPKRNPKCDTPIMQPTYTSIFAKMGRDLGINPLFPMSVALQESGWNLVHVFGTNSASNGQPLNNLFGLTKAGGNNIPFPNVQASADYWEKDWGSYVANRPTTIQGFTSDLTSNPTHMYNSNSNWPGSVQDRYKQLQQATKDCGTKF